MKVISKKILNLLLIVIFIVITLSSCENNTLNKNEKEKIINKSTNTKIDSLNISNEFDNTNNSISAENQAYDKLIKQISKDKIVKFKSAGSIIVDTGVFFGKYEQDGDLSNGPEDIEWIVLDIDKKNNEALLLSKYVIDVKPYLDSIYLLKDKYNELNNVYTIDEYVEWKSTIDEEEIYEYIINVVGEDGKNVSWETCTLRQWLNKEFYQTAFNNEEKSFIKEKELITQTNISYGKDTNCITKDNVYLLDIDDVNNYLLFDLNAEYKIGDKPTLHETYATKYAQSVENFGGGIKSGRMGQVNYWLRPTISSNAAATIHMSSYYYFSSITGIKRYTTDNQDREVGVRPVICIDLDKSSVEKRIDSIKNEPQYIIDFNKQKLIEKEVVDNKTVVYFASNSVVEKENALNIYLFIPIALVGSFVIALFVNLCIDGKKLAAKYREKEKETKE